MSDLYCLAPSVPGPQGPAGTAGTAGTNGVDAFTTLTANFTMPAEGASAVADVGNSSWITIGQILFLLGCGNLEVTAKPSGTQATLKNLKNTATGIYASNAAPATVIPSGNQLGPAGLQGPTGTAGPGSLNAISPTTTKGDLVVDDGALAPLANIVRLPVGTNGKTLHADSTSGYGVAWDKVDLADTTEVTGILAITNGGSGSSTAAGARTNLGLDPVVAAIPVLDIDWATADCFHKTLTVNMTFTFSNTAEGKDITVALTQDGVGGWTVTWPGTVKWAGGSAPTMTAAANKTDVYTFVRINGVVYGSAVQNM